MKLPLLSNPDVGRFGTRDGGKFFQSTVHEGHHVGSHGKPLTQGYHRVDKFVTGDELLGNIGDDLVGLTGAVLPTGICKTLAQHENMTAILLFMQDLIGQTGHDEISAPSLSERIFR